MTNMQIYCENDLGTLHLNFLGCNLWICDSESCQSVENLEKRLRSIYGEFSLSSLMFDTFDCSVSVFKTGSAIPFLKMSICKLFTAPCDLHSFLNIFTRKFMMYDKGCFKFVNRAKKHKPVFDNSSLLVNLCIMSVIVIRLLPTCL